MIANTASTAYPTQAENFNREWTRIDAKLVGPPESGAPAWVVMGFDDMVLKRHTKRKIMGECWNFRPNHPQPVAPCRVHRQHIRVHSSPFVVGIHPRSD